MTHFSDTLPASALGRREAASLLDAMAALPRKWVKPEVDPPRIYALPRGVLMGGFL